MHMHMHMLYEIRIDGLVCLAPLSARARVHGNDYLLACVRVAVPIAMPARSLSLGWPALRERVRRRLQFARSVRAFEGGGA
jgi:hypothetical protein